MLSKSKTKIAVSFLFAFTAAFTFLALKFPVASDAASLDNFSAGNIISNYVMENYDSMSVREIQDFLSAKGNCDDTDIYRADWYPNIHYHTQDGHFVCLADERFAVEGSDYGDLLDDDEPSQSAAEIIYEVAQKYRINPQVLIVLLQKEQGLITDSWPNSIQYRSATGFGCPDTAACDSKYYGLKNQLSSAASLFRTVLDGGWTNYPLGWNYIRYNPDAGCGGSDVYIENLATSALYRYTPYQPNQGALDAGYGTAYCGAYGNRNFYLYFQDYFGDPTSNPYDTMSAPRYMTNSSTGLTKFYTHKRISNHDMCLTDNVNSYTCDLYSDLENTEFVWEPMQTPRYLTLSSSSQLMSLNASGAPSPSSIKSPLYFTHKTILPDGRLCLLSETQTTHKSWCAIFSTLSDTEFVTESMVYQRFMKSAIRQIVFADPQTRTVLETLEPDAEVFFSEKLTLPDGTICLVSADHAGCTPYSSLEEAWTPMQFARELRVKSGTYKTDVSTGHLDEAVYMDQGLSRMYRTKTYYHGTWCLRTEYDHNLDTSNCVIDYELEEVN